MKNTFRVMASLVREEDKTKTLEEVAMEYRESMDPSLFAYAFTEVSGIIFKIAQEYEGIEEEDVASHSLEKLNNCLQFYDTNAGAKFSTYFYNVFRNEMRTLYQSSKRDKRKALVYYTTSYDYLNEEFNFEFESLGEYDYDLSDMYEMAQLTEREIRFCELTMAGYKNKEIAKMFGISQPAVTYIKQAVSEKFLIFT